MREMGDKIDQKTKADIEAQIAKLRSAIDGDDKDSIQREMDALMQLSHKVAEEAYKRAAGEQAGAQARALPESLSRRRNLMRTWLTPTSRK